MTEQLTIYEKAPTTDRPAEKLAKKHGFESLAQLAESLPQGARVLDVGAGASPFGAEVAALRPDITWVSFDYSYQNPTILEEVSKGAPDNVEYIAGDATQLDKIFEPESFDAVFSYWLMPHLSIDEPQPGAAVGRGIFNITKTGGLMSVGPETNKKPLPTIKSGKAIRITKTGDLTAETYGDFIKSWTELSEVGKKVQKLGNEVVTPFLGTTRYTKRDGRIPKIYHSTTDEYVSPFTRKGAHTTGGLAVAMVRHLAKQRRDNRAKAINHNRAW